ncbi:MAG: alkaline phosphatase family protein [Bacteroidota bacterium]
MKRTFFLLLLGVSLIGARTFGQESRLVVLISIDQFRYDYLARFDHALTKGGFAYFLQNGANFTNAHYEHSETSTGPGHAVLLSGTYACQNGIVQNTWYDRKKKRPVYCMEDETATIIGAGGKGRSPALLLGSTFGDELRIGTGFQAKVVSVSLKDRAAIPMGGKLANAAYWLVDSSFATSSYYLSELPGWVKKFNRSSIVRSYLGRTWREALPEHYYRELDRDDAPYEKDHHGLGRTFPHPVTGSHPGEMNRSYYEALRSSPFGNDLVGTFAREALLHERLGQRNTTDLLCIGFSSHDYACHAFGPQSHEVLDMTVRADSLLRDFLTFLDTHVGLERCTIVLTSDHGVAPVPEYILTHREGADAGRIPVASVRAICEEALENRFGREDQAEPIIEQIQGWNIHLNLNALAERGLSAEVVARTLADSLLAREEIAYAFTFAQLLSETPGSSVERRVKNSFYPLRSGHVVFVLKPFHLLSSGSTGTGHGSPYAYDAHVPLILLGPGIRPGSYASKASPADIAPTLSTLLGVEFPAQQAGRVLHEALMAGQEIRKGDSIR